MELREPENMNELVYFSRRKLLKEKLERGLLESFVLSAKIINDKTCRF
jgi:hypothetical protein